MRTQDALTDAQLRAANVLVAIGDGNNLCSFGRLRVANPITLFDAQQEYGLDTLRTWDAVANGTYATGATDGSVTNGSNAVGPRNANTRLTPITVSTTNGHYSVLQSRQYTRYIPGKGHLIFLTGIFAAGTNSIASLVVRTSTSGSASDTERAVQSDWNMDTFDGSKSSRNPSGVLLDFTKTQILVIQAQWLGVGRVIVGFDVDGILYPAHEFIGHANVLAVPYCQTFNLPVRMEGVTGASSTSFRSGYFDSANGVFLETTRTTTGGTINFCCCSVQSEGGEELRGFPMTVGMGTASTAVTTRRAVLSIRPKATFNSVTNRSHIELAEFSAIASTNNAFLEIVINGTLGGVPAWTSVGTNSTVEYDTAGTTVTGGMTVYSDYIIAGVGVTAGAARGMIDLRSPLVIQQVNALTATQTSLSLVATSMTGTSNISAAANWHEQVI